MIRRLLCLTLAATACVCASATAADRPRQALDAPLLADLDGDGADETVRVRELSCSTPAGTSAPPCSTADDVSRTLVVVVADLCGTGERVLTLSREMEYVSFARVFDADRDGRSRELVFEVRAGASRAPAGEGRQLPARRGGLHRRPRDALLLSAARHDRPPPAGHVVQQRVAAVRGPQPALPRPRAAHDRDLRARRRPRLLPDLHRTTYWRFDTARERYRAYRTKLARTRRSD